MRVDDWATFTGYSVQRNRTPNFVVQIEYSDQTLTFTKDPVGSNLTGDVIDGVVSSISSVSQKVFPLDGRSQIGAVTVKLIDTGSPSTITDYIRAQLEIVDSPYDPGESLRNNKVSVFVGFTDDFDDYVNVVTTFVNDVSILNQEYTISCVDVSRQMRRDIFEQKEARLADNLVAPSVSPQPDIEVNSVDGFSMLEHTDGFTDSPGETVGYIRIKDTGEIIKYTGISSSPPAFTGITREVFGTLGGAVTFDNTEEEQNWPEIIEEIYLEMTAPQMAYALLTGVVLGSSPEITLPDHWHMGVSEDDVNASEFEGIGEDLYTSDTSGVFLKFLRMKKTDGKKFVESEIHRLIGTFSPVRTDGRLGLARVNQVLSNASYQFALNESTIVKHGTLNHEASEVVNQYRIDYEWDGEKFLRSLALTDADSIARNKTVKEKVLRFKGLSVSRHSESLIYSLVNALQNRYRNPPQTLKIDAMPYLDLLEAGDVVNVSLENLTDYAGEGSLDRAFEVQGTRIDWVNGRVSFDLFASSGSASDPLITPDAPVLADAFYTSKGADLSTVLTIDGSGNVTADGSITGNADMNAAGAVYYYDGDLTIPTGRTVTISDNVQLRVNGTLTVNGKIDGAFNGVAGNTAHSGYVGNTAAQMGTIYFLPRYRTNFGVYNVLNNSGLHPEFPSLSIESGDQTGSPAPTDLVGVPSDLRGTPGRKGAALLDSSLSLVIDGGDGGASGAGLCIIAEQVVFGSGAEINLDGEAGSQPVGIDSTSGYNHTAGAGAGGGQGSLLILIDGSAALPVVSPVFSAVSGATSPVGYPAVTVTAGGNEAYASDFWPGATTQTLTGFAGASISTTDRTESSYLATYIIETA